MASNVDKYKSDLDRLVTLGGKLLYVFHKSQYPNVEIENGFSEEEIQNLPSFGNNYQSWYSESLSLLLQVLPERAEDFKGYYSPKAARKNIDKTNYTISDALRGVSVTQGGQTYVSPKSAVTCLHQQFNILAGLANRFSSTLYDIKTLVHADLLDDELHAAEELNKKGFQRGAGAIAGVVLEGHLGSVCERHGVAPKKKNPTISDFYEALKTAGVIDVAQWRFIQHLGDLRNKCDHKKEADPSKVEVTELIDGVRKVTKTVL